jgi:hypothetical protein
MLPVGRLDGVNRQSHRDNGHLLASTLSMLAAFTLRIDLCSRDQLGHVGALRGVSLAALQLCLGCRWPCLPSANLSHHRGRAVTSSQCSPAPGIGSDPLSAADRHERMMNVLIPDQVLFALQAGLLVLGFWLAVRIARNRIPELLGKSGNATTWRLLPMLAFASVITGMSLWLMARDMVVRF